MSVTPWQEQRETPALRLGGRTVRRPYLIGIGGSGMSALARLLASSGLDVAGSDSARPAAGRRVGAAGIRVDDDDAVLPEAADGLIHSAAVRADHPQLVEASRRGLPVYSYPEALGAVMGLRTGVCIAGTHGKSTTTAMLGCVLTDAGLDPSVIVGAACGQLARGALEPAGPGGGPGGGPVGGPVGGSGTGSRLGADAVPVGQLAGQPGLLLAEACEFNRSFHNYRPKVASIGQIEADHLDIYGSLDEVVRAFAEFAALVPPAEEGGVLLIAHDGAHRRVVTAGLRCRVLTIGHSPAADFQIVHDETHRRVTLIDRRAGKGAGASRALRWQMALPGEHMAFNASVAAALALLLGADTETVGRSLSAFAGLERRLQVLGDRPVPGGDVRVYDDYGHHPTEVDATLRALRQHEGARLAAGGRLVTVFQPHQHSRTRFLLDEFATSFSGADIVIVPHIYFVRDSEAEKQRVSAADLVDRLRERGVRAMHLYPFGAIVEALEQTCRVNDVLVVMGAGPVNEIAFEYMRDGSAGDAGPAVPGGGGAAAEAAGRGVGSESNAVRSLARAVGGAKRRVHAAPLRTWFRVGGGCDAVLRPRTVDELARAVGEHPGAGVIGEGANLLVDDDGVPGVVLDLKSPGCELCGTEVLGEDSGVVRARIGGGAGLQRLAAETARRGWLGLAELAGIPATFGGAVRMNAGGAYGCVADVLESVDVVTPLGEVLTLTAQELGLGYRRSCLEGVVVASGVVRLTGATPEAALAVFREVTAYKRRSQPMSERSAGCAFKNPVVDRSAFDGLPAFAGVEPADGAGVGGRVSAGLLIDRAGCKGLAVGGAVVSDRHANFIVAGDGATARDVINLMAAVRRRVFDACGVTLRPEVVVWSRHAEITQRVLGRLR